MRLGFRSPVYLRKRKLDFLDNPDLLEQAARRAARELELQFDGQPEFNSPYRKFRKSIGCKVTSTQGKGWLKVKAFPTENRNDAEAKTQLLAGIAKPDILNTLYWNDHGIYWCALHMTRSPGPTISQVPWFPENAALPDDTWFEDLKKNLGRITQIRPERTSSSAKQVFEFLDQYKIPAPPITEMTGSHGDLHWRNLCIPFHLLDWENYGSLPRGFDAAYLLSYSLNNPALCARIRSMFEDELGSSSGIACQIYCFNSQLLMIRDNHAPASYKPLVDAELHKLQR